MTLGQIRQLLADRERELVREVLERVGWNRSRAARELRCPPSTLDGVIARHPELEAEVRRLGPGRGRPSNLE